MTRSDYAIEFRAGMTGGKTGRIEGRMRLKAKLETDCKGLQMPADEVWVLVLRSLRSHKKMMSDFVRSNGVVL